MKGCYKTPKGAKGSCDSLIYNLIWIAFAATLLPSLGISYMIEGPKTLPSVKEKTCMASVPFHAIDCAQD